MLSIDLYILIYMHKILIRSKNSAQFTMDSFAKMIIKAWSKDYRAISFLRAIFTYDLFDDDDEAMEGEGNKKYVMDILLNIQSSFEFGRSDIPFITPIVIHPHISHQMPFKDIFTLSHLLFNLYMCL